MNKKEIVQARKEDIYPNRCFVVVVVFILIFISSKVDFNRALVITLLRKETWWLGVDKIKTPHTQFLEKYILLVQMWL